MSGPETKPESKRTLDLPDQETMALELENAVKNVDNVVRFLSADGLAVPQTSSPLRSYSFRNATIGSTLVARRAGR